jgi:hypothetical protein
MPYFAARGTSPGDIFFRSVCIDLCLIIYHLISAAPGMKGAGLILLPYLRKYARIALCP